jgi:hypothetical protein
MGKDKANRQVGGQAQLGHDGLEVMAIGAQAVQPDNHRDRRKVRVKFYSR